MTIDNILMLLGGLALFLYGMQMMTNGLELAAGDKMKNILERLTANPLVGVIVGALVTALVQSSSATTLMVVGFVNAGIMNIYNAVWMIMGSNVGTTITGQLIALDIVGMAPVIAFIGVGMIFFFKNKKMDAIGTFVAGLGILFIGMSMMSDSMIPLRTEPAIINLFAKFENPLIGILVGAAVTVIIQSSSASVGILQALALGGVVSLPQAIYILFGQNIGTCVTSVLGSIGGNSNAKSTTMIHVLFNVIGTILFVAITLVLPFTDWMVYLTPNNPAAQIANVHTIFNIVTTLLLLPFGRQLVHLALQIVPQDKQPIEREVPKYLNFDILDQEFHLGTNMIAINMLMKETQYMLDLVRESMQETFGLMIEFDPDIYHEIRNREKDIDALNKNVIAFTSKSLTHELTESGAMAIGLFLKISSDLERIADHAMNIAEYSLILHTDGRAFSSFAKEEIEEMEEITQVILAVLSMDEIVDTPVILEEVQRLEDQIDILYQRYEVNQIRRLRYDNCSIENSIKYSKILTDFERIGDHCLNIAKNYAKIQGTVSTLKMKEELRETVNAD